MNLRSLIARLATLPRSLRKAAALGALAGGSTVNDDDAELIALVVVFLAGLYAWLGTTPADAPTLTVPTPGGSTPGPAQPPTVPQPATPAPSQPPITSGSGDAIDINAMAIEGPSPDVRGWPITRSISRASDDGATFRFGFDVEPPDYWKWFTGNGDDNYQYTIWFAAFVGGMWRACGFIQQWQGREQQTDSPLNNWVNLWGPGGSADAGVFSDYVPRPGDTIGFFVTAGNARAFTAVSSVAERSNIVLVTL